MSTQNTIKSGSARALVHDLYDLHLLVAAEDTLQQKSAAGRTRAIVGGATKLLAALGLAGTGAGIYTGAKGVDRALSNLDYKQIGRSGDTLQALQAYTEQDDPSLMHVLGYDAFREAGGGGALVGGGAGALAGGALGAALPVGQREGETPEDRKRRMLQRAALMSVLGGGTGALLGAGGATALNFADRMRDVMPTPSSAAKLTASGSK